MAPNKKHGNKFFFYSKYNLGDFKTSCQDYTKTYYKIVLFEIYRRIINSAVITPLIWTALAVDIRVFTVAKMG